MYWFTVATRSTYDCRWFILSIQHPTVEPVWGVLLLYDPVVVGMAPPRGVVERAVATERVVHIGHSAHVPVRDV